MSRRRVAVVALASALVLAGCGGGDKKETKGDDDKASTAATSLDGSSVSSESTSAPGTGAAPTTAVTPGAPAEPDVTAVTPGSYRYATKGTANVKGTVNGAPLDNSKKVDKAWEVNYLKPQGRTQRAIYAGESPFYEHHLVHNAGSADISYLRINNGGNEVIFTPNPPARFVPVPATVGATWAWTMSSQPDPQDGKVMTRTAEFRVDRTETLTIGGTAVPVVVVVGTMTADQPLVRTYKLTTYYSEALKLIVKEREISDGDIESGNTKIHLHTDQTTTISSTSPTN